MTLLCRFAALAASDPAFGGELILMSNTCPLDTLVSCNLAYGVIVLVCTRIQIKEKEENGVRGS